MIKLKLSQNDISILKQARKKCDSFALLRRIECILYRWEQKSNLYIKDKLWVSFDSITLWVKLYRDSWIDWLLDIKYHERRKSPISEEINTIRSYVQENKISSLKHLWEYLKSNYWLEYTISNISKLAKKNWIWVWKNHQQFLEK